MERADHRISVGLPEWLWQDLMRSATESGWDISKQVRFELASNRGKAKVPSLPHLPSHEDTTRRRKIQHP